MTELFNIPYGYTWEDWLSLIDWQEEDSSVLYYKVDL